MRLTVHGAIIDDTLRVHIAIFGEWAIQLAQFTLLILTKAFDRCNGMVWNWLSMKDTEELYERISQPQTP